MSQIKGLLPAVVTPMDATGAVNVATLQRLVEWLLSQGVHGLYVCGSTGEGLILTPDERRCVVETVVSSARGRGRIMVHVGALSTDLAVDLAKHAEQSGADAVSAVPPFAFGRTPDGIHVHYEAVARATRLPLYLYNIPSLTSLNVNADLIADLAQIPGVKGMKFSSADLFEEYRVIKKFPDFDVFHGCDELLLYGLMMGAVGGIGMTYNLRPDLYASIYEAFGAGELERANELQLQASRGVEVMLAHAGGNLVGLGKALMKLVGFDCGTARLPNPPVDPQVVETVRQQLLQCGFLPAV